jgi:carbon storage regulator CsrA
MLVLSRKLHEKILLPGIDASIEVVGVKGNAVRLGIQAPVDVVVLREELRGAAPAARSEAARAKDADADARLRESNHFLNNRLNAAAIGLALLRKQHEMGLVDQMGPVIARLERELDSLRRGSPDGAKAQAPPRSAVQPRKACKALLVEDDQNERELLASFLRIAGLEVDTAGDGVDALDYLHTHNKPDVVLLDMVLPRCDGPSTIRAIREDPAYADLKIFAVTGQAPGRFGVDGGSRGVDRWFKKPLNAEDLLRDLRNDLTGGE